VAALWGQSSDPGGAVVPVLENISRVFLLLKKIFFKSCQLSWS
jgi:hypothetical protein